MSLQPVPAPKSKPEETAVQKAERLLHDVDVSQNDLRVLYGFGKPGSSLSPKNPLFEHLVRFRKVLKQPLPADTMVERLKQLRAAYAELYQDWGGEKDIHEIEDPVERANVAAKRLIGLLPCAKALCKIQKAFDELSDLLNDPNVSKDDKQKIQALGQALREHYRALSLSNDRDDPANMLIDDLEDIFRSLNMMMDTYFRISSWKAKGGEGHAPWVFAGVYTDDQHRKRPIMVRAC